MTTNRRTPRTQSGERIVDIARRLAKNPKGFRTCHQAFEGIPPSTVGCSLQHLTARGELVKVRVTHKLVLFFGSKADADAQIAAHQHSPQAVIVPKARVSGPADASRAKLTLCPAFTPRFVALDVLCPLLRQAPHRRAA